MALRTVNVHLDRQALRRARQLAGLSVKDLATRVGCSPAWISILENHDGRTCSPAVLAAICDALNIADRSLLMRDQPEQSAA